MDKFIDLSGISFRPEKVSALWIETGRYNGNGHHYKYLYAIIDGVQVTLQQTTTEYGRELQEHRKEILKALLGNST